MRSSARVTQVRRGVALTGHWLTLPGLVEIARRAEAHGFEVLFVDGDTAEIPARDDALLYGPDALQAALLAATSQLRVGAIRIPGFTPIVLQARSLAALQALSGGRALGFFGVGSGRHPAKIGLAERSAAERIGELDESLGVLRALLCGQRVTHRGRYLQLEGARSAPCEPPVPVIVAAARPRALQVAARHADVWDANVPPLRAYLEPARAQLQRPLETWIWVFARPGDDSARAVRAYRRHCPWFLWLPDGQAADALLCGDPAGWPRRLDELAEQLAVDLVVLDLIGLDQPAALRAIAAFPEARPARMS
jgi:alkanesulfonate monooxygenase SsuD/methylene tetrahydromethanopterin reductase-like flavin-dependent oxidoreductase (luciferase family)